MNIVLITILLLTCSISILFGLRYAYIFIYAIIKHKNSLKYKKYLIFSFIYLFIIPLFLFLFFSIISSLNLGGSIPLLQVKTSQYTSEHGFISYSPQKIDLSSQNEIQLTIKNKYHLPKEFYIDISCEMKTCANLFEPYQNNIFLNPGKTFVLPITIDITQVQKYKIEEINLSIVDHDGYLHDTLSLPII
jgi:hypothetical protein